MKEIINEIKKLDERFENLDLLHRVFTFDIKELRSQAADIYDEIEESVMHLENIEEEMYQISIQTKRLKEQLRQKMDGIDIDDLIEYGGL